MANHSELLCTFVIVVTTAFPMTTVRGQETPRPTAILKAVLLSASQATSDRIRAAESAGNNAVVIELRGSSANAKNLELEVARRVQRSEMDLYYWIEVARCPELADAHPDWMASLQGHQQWRRHFKDPPQPKAEEVVKTYPWVPILYKEAFEAQLERTKRLLEEKPTAKGVFLNDLQGGPSACGCGNTLCRWTADYGPIRTATPLEPDAAARFTSAVAKFIPDSRVIPVWVTECEAHDGAPDGLCAGVGCFNGICWKAYTAQLMPVARQSDQLAVLLPFRAFQRDLPVYGDKARWIEHAIRSFQSMPPRHGGTAIESSRLIAVLQGWDVTGEDITAQIRVTENTEAAGYVVSYLPIRQSWHPRVVKWK